MSAQKTTTEILGFSQTYQWYTGQPFEFPVKDPTFKPQKDFLARYKVIPNCQARFGFGGDLTKWKDPNYIGFDGHATHNLRKRRTEVTRLIFNVSGESRRVREWRSDVENVVSILLDKYPNLEELYLQAVIGGTDDQSQVRAVKNQPLIVEAINGVVSSSSISILGAGAIVKLENYGFSDSIGHLTVSGARKAREQVFKFYGISI